MMTWKGIVLLDVVGLLLLVWVLNLVRRDRLYVGYGVIFVLAILVFLPLVSIHKFQTLVTRWVDIFFPASGLSLLALCFTVFMFVYILSQTTLLANRLARLVQNLAIERAKEQMKDDASSAHHAKEKATREDSTLPDKE